MGGLAGFIGTYLIGPRTGLFQKDRRLEYILEDKIMNDDDANLALREYLKSKTNHDNSDSDGDLFEKRAKK